MKKLYTIGAKIVLFMLGWMLCSSLVPIPAANSPAVGRLWLEVIPLACLIVFTVILWILDGRQEKIRLVKNPIKSILTGLIAGFVWVVVTVFILSVMGVLQIATINQVEMVGVWIAVVLLNVMMQELLVRGYLYHMLQMNFNTIVAVIVTTLIFTLLHGSVLTAGIIPILNIVTMSLVMTAALETAGSLLAPVFMHFMWVSINAILLGTLSFAGEYPNIFGMAFEGNPLFTGEAYKFEGSLIVLILNVIVGVLLFVLGRKMQKEETEEEE